MYALAINRYGEPENFELIKIFSPPIKENQIRVEVKGSSVNPIDFKIRRGELKFITGKKFPKILGSDFSGIVTESKSEKFKIGDEVFGMIDPLTGGAYASEIVVDETHAFLKPRELNYSEAATLPMVGLTASEALCRHGKIEEGKRVLINGCTGGVGTIAVQLAHIYTDDLTTICSTRNVGFMESMGVENIINYEEKSHIHDGKYDIIYDTIGNLSYTKTKKMLTKDGLFITNAFTFKLFLQGMLNKRCKRIMVVPDNKYLGLITCLVDQNMLQPVIEKTYSWKDMAEAHRLAEKGKVRGKIAIEMD